VTNFYHSIAQISYDFSSPLPPSGQEVKSVDLLYFGKYSCDETDMDYEFNEQGVSVLALIYSSISRETIRESSAYRVSNGWLYGVKVNDSIPCELQGEYYHFALLQRTKLVGDEGSRNILMKINNQIYILNFEENGYYTPSVLEFKGSELHIRHFSFDEGTSCFSGITEQLWHHGADPPSVSLRPTKEEWQKLPVDLILGKRFIYNRVID
jgi:hypothetical protein